MIRLELIGNEGRKESLGVENIKRGKIMGQMRNFGKMSDKIKVHLLNLFSSSKINGIFKLVYIFIKINSFLELF